MGALASFWDRLLDLLYPPRCLGCGALNHWLCPACLASCPNTDEPRLVPVDANNASWRLPVYSFTVHQGVAREAVHALKYEGRRVLAGPMARCLADCLPEGYRGARLVLGVPLHDRRRRERGYNQSELLARALAAEAGLPAVSESVKRVRATPPQVGLSARERVDNVRGAFLADERVRGERVLLVDDVCTTGATMAACAAAVAMAGGEVVAGVTFTRARAGADP